MGRRTSARSGRIAIPKIGIDAALHEGIRLTTLDRGPGHWPGSAMPGEIGNVVVAGHRTSHGADFRDTDDLVPGDIVTFTTADGVFDYAVTSTEIVGPGCAVDHRSVRHADGDTVRVPSARFDAPTHRRASRTRLTRALFALTVTVWPPCPTLRRRRSAMPDTDDARRTT